MYEDLKDSKPGDIGNILKEYADIAKEAAKQTGFNIEITNDATDVSGRPQPHLVHLTHLNPTISTGPFWAKYRELKGE